MRRLQHGFSFDFAGSPDLVWQALGDTARLNEAAGVPRHRITETPQDDGTVRFFGTAQIRPFRVPVTLAWEEVPVEWVDGDWYRHTRRYLRGPVREMTSTLRLETEGGQTRGHFAIETVPRHTAGRLAVSKMLFPATEKSFRKLFAQADQWAQGESARPFTAKTAQITPEQKDRAEALGRRLDASPHGHGLGTRLADLLMTAPDSELFRIRPLALAKLWREPAHRIIELCLQAVHDGLLELRWDLLCPRCRGAKLRADALDRLPTEAHCPSCNVGYGRDFARNVEVTFRPAGTVRTVDDGEFCLFGPMSTPHIKVQLRLEAGESRDVPARLADGAYRLRTLEPGPDCDFTVAGGELPMIVFSRGRISATASGSTGILSLVNRHDRPTTLVVENPSWVTDALTGAQAIATQAFRDLFAEDVLQPGQELDVSQVTLLFTDLKDSTAFYEKVGDVHAYGVVREHFSLLQRVVREHRGGIVKTIGDAVMAAFADPADGVRAALAIQAEAERFNANSSGDQISLKLGLHAGRCIAVTLNGRLDYFGSTVNMAARLQGEAGGGETILSQSLFDDPAVRELLVPYDVELEAKRLKGFDAPTLFARLGEKDYVRVPSGLRVVAAA